MTMPGVQKPHWSPCSCRNAAAIGCSSSGDGESPSIVVTSAPSACTASTVHDFTDSPSRSTVQAPHDVVSQPMFVRRQAEGVAQVVHEQQARLDVRRPTARR